MPTYFGGAGYYGAGYYTEAPMIGDVFSMAQLPTAYGQKVESMAYLPTANIQAVQNLTYLPTLQGAVTSMTQLAVTATKELQSMTQLRAEQWSKGFYDTYATGNPINYVQAGVRLKLHNLVDGTVDDLTPWLQTWSITQSRAAPATMNVTLTDKDRELRPILSEGSTFFGKFKGDNFDQDYNIRRYWQLEITVRGETWASPWFLLMEYSWAWQDGGSVSMSFTDLSEILLQNNFEINEFISGNGTYYTSHDVIRAILDKCKIPHNIQFTPYPVPKYSPSGGTALDYIKEILHKRQAEWRFDGNTFIAHDHNYNKTGPARWTFVDKNHIQQISFRYSVQELINEITIKKVEQSNVVAEQECTGNDCIGTQTLSINPPQGGLSFVIEEITNYANSGKYTGVWLDANGRVLANGWGYGGGTPASSFEWVYEPQMQIVGVETAPGTGINGPVFGSWTPHYRVSVIGSPPDYGPGVEGAFTVTIRNTASQERYGKKPEQAPIEDPLIPNTEVATWMANKLIEESIRKTDTSSWTGPLNPFVLPADMVKVTAGIAGVENRVFYVEGITKSGTANDAMMTVEQSKWPD